MSAVGPEREWRESPSFPDYEISSDGLVRRAKPGKGARAGWVLAQTRGKDGRLRVSPRRDGLKITKLVHALVCEAFRGPRPDGLEVRHLDGDADNNHWTNLVWGTHWENMQDVKRHGTNHNAKRTHCSNGHEFSEENTAPRTDGGRLCRTCHRATRRHQRAEAKAKKTTSLLEAVA